MILFLEKQMIETNQTDDFFFLITPLLHAFFLTLISMILIFLCRVTRSDDYGGIKHHQEDFLMKTFDVFLF